MTRIFITGCARSGTTLLCRLFHAFQHTQVISQEINIDDFCASPASRPVLVGKRTPLTILSVPLPASELERQWSLAERSKLRIVNIIRDGRDVVHQNPTGPRVNVNRWIGCILQSRRFRRRITAEVRYEELVRDPDAAQDRLARALDLRPSARFSRYPDFVPAPVFDEAEYKDFPYYTKRPVDDRSVGHSATEYAELCSSPEEKALFERTLARLGYAAGKKTGPWTPGALLREEAVFRRLSRALGYDCR